LRALKHDIADSRYAGALPGKTFELCGRNAACPNNRLGPMVNWRQLITQWFRKLFTRFNAHLTGNDKCRNRIDCSEKSDF